MATTGLMTFNPDLGDLVEEAFERAGLEFRSAYDFQTARRSLNYITMEWQNRGINMWTIDQQTITPTIVGTETYNTAAGTIAIMDVSLRTDAGELTSQADYMLNRISKDTYLSIPNKLTQARPLQYMVDRIDVGSTVPTLTFWPVPDLTTYQFVYNRMRRIQDATLSATQSDGLLVSGTTPSGVPEIPCDGTADQYIFTGGVDPSYASAVTNFAGPGLPPGQSGAAKFTTLNGNYGVNTRLLPGVSQTDTTGVNLSGLKCRFWVKSEGNCGAGPPPPPR